MIHTLEFLKCQVNRKNIFGYAWLLAFLILPACDAHVHMTHDHELLQINELSGKTKKEFFTVHLSTVDKSAAPIGKYHDWKIVLTDQESNPVDHASIAITGGMPTHGHGLPTNPEVRQYLGNGQYLLEGMKFSMDGNWLLKLHILADGKKDAVEFNFVVSH